MNVNNAWGTLTSSPRHEAWACRSCCTQEGCLHSVKSVALGQSHLHQWLIALLRANLQPAVVRNVQTPKQEDQYNFRGTMALA